MFTVNEFREYRQSSFGRKERGNKDIEYWVEIPSQDMDGNPCPGEWACARLLCMWEDEHKFVVETDYTVVERYAEGMPSEDDIWMAAVPYHECRFILTKEEKIAKYGNILF